MSNTLKSIVSVSLGILVFCVLYYGTQALIRGAADTEQPTGITITRDTYVASCAYWAKQEPGSEELTEDMIRTYCGCVYDKGVAYYGNEEFIRVDSELTRTGQATPEINTIVNECVQAML